MTSTARQAFRRAVLEGGPRLVEAMFLCQVSTASEALSGVTQHLKLAAVDRLCVVRSCLTVQDTMCAAAA